VDDGLDDAEAALADLARVEIAGRFADRRPEVGEGGHVATFTSQSVGDVTTICSTTRQSSIVRIMADLAPDS
jgi:hypothetical protein